MTCRSDNATMAPAPTSTAAKSDDPARKERKLGSMHDVGPRDVGEGALIR
jgi:hypothetical protein